MVSKRISRTLVLVVTVFVLLCFAATGFYFGLSYVLSQNARFARLDAQFSQSETGGIINKDTPGAVELFIPRAADTQQIAELLKENNVIENTFMFTLLSKFNGFDSSYMAGTHFVTATMSYDEIMYVLSQKPHSVQVTFPEGLSYKDVKAKLRAAGVNFDETVMDNMVRNPQLFLDYDFVTEIEKNEGRDWLLQGYLYPDTYEFDINTDEETIIRTFLNNTEKKLVTEYKERAAKIGMSIDQVITLASIIQNECSNGSEMLTVSGVFRNRLKKEMPLESCATINYLRKEAGQDIVLWTNENDKTYDSPYNTYNHAGLPPGPICSPGDDAIRAALWPETHKHLFFCAKGDGTNVFADTEAEQQKNVEKYRKLAESGQTEATEASNDNAG
ncbi:MAG: endolytic transglycosylase MltG [Clostridiaceae bacterium]|nr:endolytic transglycosylase MltG [Clostridiaceae bacterium]